MAGTRRLAAGLPILAALLAALGVSSFAAPPRPASAAAASPADTPLWGLTIDRIPRLKGLLGSIAALPSRPTARVYLDVHEPASYYAQPLTQIAGVSTVMGELLDSSDEKAISVAAFQERVESYIATLGRQVGIWEVGNEVNGNWTGNYSDVALKLTEAYEDVAAVNGRTALTLYANDFGPEHCGDGAAELTPLEFSQRYVPRQVADGLDYVLLSYYPTQCGGREPTAAELAGNLERLHAFYPNAALGFGEVGLPRPAGRATLLRARQIMQWAYSLNPGLPYYIGGYFWWYAVQDALRARAPLREALSSAFEEESAALLGAVAPSP